MKRQAGVGAVALLALVSAISANSAAPDAETKKSETDDLATVVRTNQRLAAGLYAKLATSTKPGENLVFAPCTLTPLLASLATARGSDAEKEIRKALDLNLERTNLENALAALALHRRKDLNLPEQYYLGLQIEQGKDGVLVKSVQPGSLADQAGFQPGDRILAIRTLDVPGEGTLIRTAADFVSAMDQAPELVRVRCRTAKDDQLVTRRMSLSIRKNPAPPRKADPQIRFWSSLWYAAAETPSPAYRDYLRTALDVQTTVASFEKDRKKLEVWFTRKVVPEREAAIDAESCPKDLGLAYADSLYFRPSWSSAVQVGAPLEMTFLMGRRRVHIPAVPLAGRFLVKKDEKYQSVEIPCLGGVTVVYILPTKPEDLAEVEKRLGGPDLAKFLETGVFQDMVVTAPQFDLARLNDLRKPLADLGMTTVFAPGAKGVTILQQVQTKFYAPVSEDGDAGPPPGVGIPLAIDHPFVFLVYDRRNKEVLIVGRMANPRER